MTAADQAAYDPTRDGHSRHCRGPRKRNTHAHAGRDAVSLVDVVTLPRRLANLLAEAQPAVPTRPVRAHLVQALHCDLDQAARDAVEAAVAALDDLEEPRRFEIRNADGADDTAAELLIYSEIGGYFGIEAAAFAEQLAGVTARNLTVRINSPGGSVWEGLAVANLLRSHPARVTVMVDGIAASIASVIMLAGDEIVIGQQAQVMVHDAIGLTLGNPADHREMADLLDRQSDNIAAAYRDRAGGRIDTWRNRMRNETWFLGEEAVSAGLADRMAPPKKKADCGPAKPDGDDPEGEPDEDMPAAARLRQWDLSAFRYPGRSAAPDPTAEPAGEPTGEEVRPGGPVMRITLDAAGFRAAVRDGIRDAGLAVVDTACPSHDTGAEEGTWSKSENEGRLPSPMPVATAKRFYGAYDADRVEDGKIPKDAGHLPHHFVSADGAPGKASISGVRAALARLGQTHGLTDADRAAVERHLRGHLPAADGEEDNADVGPTPDPPAAVAPLAFGRPQTSTPRTLAFGRGGAQ